MSDKPKDWQPTHVALVPPCPETDPEVKLRILSETGTAGAADTCPFCRSQDVRATGAFLVRCHGCGAQGTGLHSNTRNWRWNADLAEGFPPRRG